MTKNNRRGGDGHSWGLIHTVSVAPRVSVCHLTKMARAVSIRKSEMDAGTQSLSPQHLETLHRSAINDEVISARGYRTITDERELQQFGFNKDQRRAPGLLLPLIGPDGSNGVYVYRPDNPRVIEERGHGKLPDGTYPNKVAKYEYPAKAPMRIDCPPLCRQHIGNPKVRLWITEGQKKADSLASAGECAIALLGVWNFKGKNKFGGTTLLSDFDWIHFEERDVRIIFDSDMNRNPNVRAAMERLKEHLQRKKAHVSAVYLPAAPDGSKQGVDDFLAGGHTINDLESLVEGPREAVKPAAPVFELLENEPPTMRRPLALVNGQAFAATWVNVRVTLTESVTKKGEVIKHNPPVIQTERRLMIVGGDGHLYGDGGDAVLSTLEFQTRLDEAPPAEKLWSVKGIKKFRGGYRANPVQVFNHVTDIIDRFIDFDRSLAEQRTMAELIACYVFATYMLDAFTVVGYLYPNGDRGSGKTQLLQVICEMAYLGQVILAGGSYATLRDMADYGATLAFDDAEGLSDPKRTDPDKRNLLLAGNRRGNTVALKELVGDRWQTRYVNTFCPRLFSATQLPDPILGSRTIVVPLIRTPDRFRANADPLDYALWMHDRRELIDDLWALSVVHLKDLPSYEARVNEHSRLTGRSLEPWRALLAVALWLQDAGVTDLWKRMEKLSFDYQSERPTLETSDLTAIAIQALCDYVVSVANDISDVSPKTVTITTKKLTETIQEIAVSTEADIDVDRITSRRVGKVMSKMRMKYSRTGKARQWDIPFDELARRCISYGIPVPPRVRTMLERRQNDTLSANVTNVTDVITSSGEGDGRDISDVNDMCDVSEVREVIEL